MSRRELNNLERKSMRLLLRRRDFLIDRVVNGVNPKSYDKQEAGSLTRLLRFIVQNTDNSGIDIEQLKFPTWEELDKS